MPPLVFVPATMATGVESVDAQHRQLLTMINDLVGALERGDGADATRKALGALQGYTKTHFSHEEGCMVKIACPVAALNAQAHQVFLKSVDDFAKEFATTGPTRAMAFKLQGTMASWLVTHIINTDTKMRPCVPAGVRM
jgi:hemerythrin-like metal-binding protein